MKLPIRLKEEEATVGTSPSGSTWPLSLAKARLSELIRAARRCPQLIASDGTPAAAVIAIEEYNELMTLRNALILQRRRDAVAALRKLDSSDSSDDFQIPDRGERPAPKLGDEG